MKNSNEYSPESAESKTDFDNLEKEVPFNEPITESTPTFSTDSEKNATLDKLRQQIEATYAKADVPSDEVVSTIDTIEEVEITPKERSMFDLPGKMRDNADFRKITNLIYDTIDHPENAENNTSEAEKLLNPYIANKVIAECIDAMGGASAENGITFKLLNHFPASILKQKFLESGKSSEYVITNYCDVMTGKFQDVVTDVVAARINDKEIGQRWSLTNDADKEPLLSDQLKNLSEENHEKIFNAFCKNDNLNGAVQLLTPKIGQKYHDMLKTQLSTPFQIAYAVQKGDLQELAPPEFTDLIQQSIDTNANEANQLSGFKCFSSIEAATSLGPTLLKKIICETPSNGAIPPYDESYPTITVETASRINAAYENLTAHHLDFGYDFIRYLSKHPSSADVITKMKNFSAYDINAFNLANSYDVIINSESDLERLDKPVQEAMEKIFNSIDHYYGAEQQAISDPDIIDEMKEIRLNNSANEICHYFFGYKRQTLSALLSIGANKTINFSDTEKANSIMRLAKNVLECNDVDQLRNFYRQAKDIAHPRELQQVFDQLKNEAMSQIATNYNSELLTDDKLNELNVSPDHEPIDYQGKKISVRTIDGQDFSILVHKLGAFGNTDLSDPSVWDTRTSGNPFISTSLIGNKCLHLAGGTNRKTLADGIFYGFGQIDQHSILGMSEQDLWTYNDEERPGLFDRVQSQDPNIKTVREEIWYDTPEKLLEATLRSKQDDDYSHNEVVLDRYHEDGSRLHPTCIISFGTNKNQINQDSLNHAAYFNVPIYLINDGKCQKHAKKGLIK